jgi:dihydrofolate synthase / folylpolyglutamate synthase
LPVPGNHSYQIQNAAAVLMVLQAISDFFPVSQQVVFESLLNFRMPGRFQVIPAEVPCILDVAHNPQSAAMLAANIKALPATGRVHLVLGMLKDKNHAAFMRELLPCVDCWYVSTLATTRGALSSDLAGTLRLLDPQLDIVEFDEIASAILAAQLAAMPGDRIIVSGSFVTVGDAIRHLEIEV